MAEKKRILIFDDSPLSLEMERSVLEERGYKVAAASSLAEFEEHLKRFAPEIILTDLMMPEISGKDVVRFIKQDMHTTNIPIVLFSSQPDRELSAIAEQSGADGYLSKANGVEKLGEMVDELVEAILW